MSIRLRFTLLYNAILAITLAVFGSALYLVQANSTYYALQKDLERNATRLEEAVRRANPLPNGDLFDPKAPNDPHDLSGEQALRDLPEREILRVLSPQGDVIASPFARTDEPLPLAALALQAAQNGQETWESVTFQEQEMLLYTRPVQKEGKLLYILQVARSLTERNRSLQFLASAFGIASLLTILVAFGIGWGFAGLTLNPIRKLTQTAQTIGEEKDFSRRVAYQGPQDEIGQLATTFNAMLARLQDAYQQIAHALEMQRNFVADVSHELRTPLTTLRGNLGLLGRKPTLPPEDQTDILKDMTEESDRLIRLVNDLLILARADAGRSLTPEALSLPPLLEEVTRQARQLAPERQIRLQAAPNLRVWADRDALKQILLIGLDNALKHTPGDVEILTQAEAGFVEIKVQDSGEGIPPEKLAHLFDRFYRGEESLTLPGFGLGLPIAQSLTENMGGQIAMQSQPGKGSALLIRLPAPLGAVSLPE